MHLAQIFIARQILIRGLEHGALVFLRNSQPRERECIGQHRLRDALGSVLLHLRPKHAGQKGSAQPDAGKKGQETPARVVTKETLPRFFAKETLPRFCVCLFSVDLHAVSTAAGCITGTRSATGLCSFHSKRPGRAPTVGRQIRMPRSNVTVFYRQSL